MATCSDGAHNETSHLKNYHSTAQHPYHNHDINSPLSSTMGSVSSLLNDSGYRGGSSTNRNDTTLSDDKDAHVYEDLEIGPPQITPISGRLEKHKEKRLIKPIAVRPITPNGAPSSRGSATPDNIADLPRVPDVVSAAQTHRDHVSTGTNHFAPARPYPIKSQSLQDIKFMNGGKRSSISSVHQLCELKPSLKRAPISQSLNQLNFNYLYNSHQNGGHRPPDYLRNNRTNHSSYNSDYRHHPPLPMQDSRRHSNSSFTSSQAMDYRSVNHYDDSLSHASSHLSSGVVMEEDEMETIYELKQKIQEHESQITILRQTMEQNEQIIFKVYEEKQQMWDDEMDEMREDLKHAEDKMYKMEQTLRRQIYQLEQDKKRMTKDMDKLRHERDILHRKLGSYKDEKTTFLNQIEEAKWQVCQKSGEISLLKTHLKDSKSEISHKMNEVINMKSKLKDAKMVLGEKENEVCMLKERLSQKDENSVQGDLSEEGDSIDKSIASDVNDAVEQLQIKLCQKENELSSEKFEVVQLQEARDRLEKQLSEKEKEFVAFQESMGRKGNELSQSKCEISYLQEVQEKLSQQICEKNNEIVDLQDSLKQLRENDEVVAVIREKLLQREREVIALEEKLGQIESEKDSEVSTLHRRLSQKECEISAIQAKFNQIEREKLLLQSKVARLKDNNNVGTQKLMEQDMMKLQVQVTKQERLLLEQNNELSLQKHKHMNENKGLQTKLSNMEKDCSKWHEKVIQREGEIKNVREKLNAKENEIARLKGKLNQHEGREASIQSQNLSLKRDIGNLKEEIQTLKSEKIALEAQLEKARSETITVQRKFEKVTNEVRGLKNQMDSTLHNGLISQSDDVKEPPKSSVIIDNLQTEVQKLKTELKKTKDLNEEQQSYFEKERDTWQEEKEKVIKYQKQLQLNYIQMFRKNKNLEKEIQHLMVEFERRHLNEVVDHV